MRVWSETHRVDFGLLRHLNWDFFFPLISEIERNWAQSWPSGGAIPAGMYNVIITSSSPVCLCWGMRTTSTSQCPVRVREALPAPSSSSSSSTGESFRLVPPSISCLPALTAPSLFPPSRRGAVNMTGQYRYQKAQSFVNEPFALQFQSEKTGRSSICWIWSSPFPVYWLHLLSSSTRQQLKSLFWWPWTLGLSERCRRSTGWRTSSRKSPRSLTPRWAGQLAGFQTPDDQANLLILDFQVVVSVMFF